jgi:hypothetical protein
MSRALSCGNGRAKPTKEMMVLPFALISKVPLRGFSSLILTVATPFSAASILAARVLKAPQDLQASMVTMDLPALVEPFVGAAALGAAFAFLAIVFLGAISSPSRRFVFHSDGSGFGRSCPHRAATCHFGTTCQIQAL